MSSNCKVVKILSLIMLLLGVISLVGGVFMAVAAPAASDAAVENPVLTAQVMGVLFAVTGVIYFVVGVIGARGANNAAKLGSFIMFGSVIAIVNIFETVLAYLSEASFWQNLMLALVALVAVIFAARAKKESQAI